MLPERQVKVLVVCLALVFLLDFVQSIDWLKFTVFAWGGAVFSIRFLLIKILFLFGFLGLWRLKKYGWIVTTGLIADLTFSILYAALLEIESTRNEQALGLDEAGKEVSDVLKYVLGGRPLWFYVVELIVATTVLGYLNSESIKSVFKISKREMWLTGGLTFVFMLFDVLLSVVMDMWWGSSRNK